ncbi:multidrug transporter subunit MdtN [Paraburkholderia sp. J10-1]|uniref:multidrug transporter subunit MdtN n=1 Tax=Paraburkholderia sp. J10-1 TaxID=2805430 RepID=UPI002AB74387|nr:multidrug transporter subunit MdtN [Paraburkholderia sp. J10-1]
MAGSSNEKQNRKWPALALALLALLLGIYVIFRLDTAPRTDDAYVSADTIDVAPEVSGRIVELAVKDNQRVKKGDVLFRIDPRSFENDLARSNASLVALDKQIETARRTVKSQEYAAESARAKVESARATAAKAAQTFKRTEPLLAPGYVSSEDLDQARTATRTAQADLASAEQQAHEAEAAVTSVEALVAQRDVVQTEIALAQLHLDQATVRAPFDGRVVSLKTAVGEFASAQKAIFTLIDTGHWYVMANFRETELKGIRPGMAATVYLMNDSTRRFHGEVDSVGYGVLPDDGGSVVDGLPKVQRTINWVRVAQRFPVKIRVDNADPEAFRIGASAVALLEHAQSAGTKKGS